MKRAPTVWILIGIFVIIIGGLQYVKLHGFGYNGLDLGIYTNVLWSLSHGHGFASSIHDPSYLGDHLELWLVPLAGVFRLWPDALLLLWAQTVCLGLAAWPLSQLAKRLVGPQAVLPTAILFLAHPLLFNVALYEFHGLTLVVPVIAWSIVAYQQKRYRLWIGLIIASLLAREDMPLLILGWAALAGLDRRSWRWWAIPGLAAIVWFLGAQNIIAAHNPLDQYKYLAFYGWLGSTPADMATFPFRHPVVFLGHLFQFNNWYTVILVTASFGFLPWWSKRQLIPLGLVFIQLLLLGSATSSVVHIHYLAPYLPFLIWSSLATLKKLQSGDLKWKWIDRGIVVTAAACIVAAGMLYGQLTYGPLTWPWKQLPDQGQTEPRILHRALAEVGPTDRVLTNFELLPRLANRQTVYSLNYLYLGRRQYTESPYTIPSDVDVAIIDWQQLYQYQFFYKTTLYQGLTGAQRIEQFLQQQNLYLVNWTDSVAVYRRDGNSQFQPVVKVPTTTASSQELSGLTLVEPPVTEAPVLDSTSAIPITMRFRIDQKKTKPVSIRFVARQSGKDVWSSTRLLGQGTMPIIDWEAGEYIVHYQLVLPPSFNGAAELSATLVELEGGFQTDRLLKFRPVVSDEKVLGTIKLGSFAL